MYQKAKAAARNRFPTLTWLWRGRKSRRSGEAELRFLADVLLPAIDGTLVCFDLGASRGMYTHLFRQYADLTIALEPNPASYASLKRIRASRVMWLNCAAGDRDGLVDLAVPYDSKGEMVPSLSSVAGHVKVSLGQEGLRFDTVRVPQLPLDALASLVAIHDPDFVFVKIDVEGYEHEALLGMENLLLRHQPMLLIEIEKRHDLNYTRTFDLLRNHGYRSFYVRDGALNACDELVVDDAYLALMERGSRGRLADPRPHKSGEGEYVHNFLFLAEDQLERLDIPAR
jgi:FkbM family methyltransferase